MTESHYKYCLWWSNFYLDFFRNKIKAVKK